MLPAPGSPAASPAHPVPSSPARLRRLPASPAGPSSSIPARRTASGKRGVAAGPGTPNPGCPAPRGRDWQGMRAGVQQGGKRDRSGGRGMRAPQGSGALGNTAVSLAPQRPELAWGRRCPQPRARKGAQRAIEGLSGPHNRLFSRLWPPRPRPWPEGASKTPTSGPSAGCGPAPSGTAALPSALAAGSASPCLVLAPAPLGKGRSHLAALPSCLLLPSHLLPSAACTYPTGVESA